MPLLCRVANLLFRGRLVREIDAGLETHLEMRIEANIAAGMSESEARRAALVRFGNCAATRAE